MVRIFLSRMLLQVVGSDRVCWCSREDRCRGLRSGLLMWCTLVLLVPCLSVSAVSVGKLRRATCATRKQQLPLEDDIYTVFVKTIVVECDEFFKEITKSELMMEAYLVAFCFCYSGLIFLFLFSAGKLLGKRFTTTSRFVVSSKVWMNTIPTRDCDILMTFPPKTPDHTLMWILARLRARTPELAVHVRHHSNTGVHGFYFTVTYEK